MKALALATAAVVAAATLTTPAHATSTAQQVHSLRHSIVLHRQRTWHFQLRAGVAATRTVHAERRTRSLPFLRWINRLWLRRQGRARKAASRPPQPFSRPGSVRAYAGCLAPLIDREDPSWNPTKYNTGGSGAYGLPQALPGSKMASAGSDWRTNPLTQIRWMRGYVAGRYGSCAAALAHSYAYGWY